MGLFAYLKNKFSKKKEQPSSQSQTLKYQKGLAKSRAAFADRLEELSKRYDKVNADYFDELEQILIEADVGVELTLKLLDNLLSKSQKEGIKESLAFPIPFCVPSKIIISEEWNLPLK